MTGAREQDADCCQSASPDECACKGEKGEGALQHSPGCRVRIRRSGDPAIKADLTIEQLQDFLVMIAPVVGTARVMSTAGHIAQAFGIAAPALAETEAEAIANAEAQSRSKS